MGESPPPSVLLRTLETHGLVRATAPEPEPEFGFRHELVHEVAYRSLTRQDRKRLHREIGEVLETLPGAVGPDRDAALARHFAEADQAEKAVSYSLRAARHAVEVLAFGEALMQLEAAERLTAEAAHADLRRQVFEQRGDVFARMRLGTRAIEAYRQAREAAPAGDAATRRRLDVKVLRTAAAVRWAVDRAAYRTASVAARWSRRALERALPAVDAGVPAGERVHLFAALSLDAWRNLEPPDWPTAMRYAGLSVEVAESTGDPLLQSTALEALGEAQLGRSDLRSFHESALRRLELVEDPAFADRLQRIDGLRSAGAALTYLGRYEEALVILRRAEAEAEALQAVDQQFNALSLQCQCAFRLDRWEEVLRLEQRWTRLELQVPSERTGPVCFPLALAAIVHAQRGDAEAAAADQRRSYAIMLEMGPAETWRSNAHY